MPHRDLNINYMTVYLFSCEVKWHSFMTCCSFMCWWKHPISWNFEVDSVLSNNYPRNRQWLFMCSLTTVRYPRDSDNVVTHCDFIICYKLNLQNRFLSASACKTFSTDVIHLLVVSRLLGQQTCPHSCAGIIFTVGGFSLSWKINNIKVNNF